MATNAAQAAAESITIPNGISVDANGWNILPNCTYTAAWSLEGVGAGLSTDPVTGLDVRNGWYYLVGGYDFKNGKDGYQVGDLFIDIDGTRQVPSTFQFPSGIGNGNFNYNPAPWNHDGNSSTPAIENQGWDFVVRMNFDTSYTAYDIRTVDATFKSGYFRQNDKANPWRLVTTGLTSFSGTMTYSVGVNEATAETYVLGQNLVGSFDRNVVGLDLSWLAAYLPTSGTINEGLRITMGCDNASLVAQDTEGFRRVPDGGMTLLMLGSGMLSLLGIRRKN